MAWSSNAAGAPKIAVHPVAGELHGPAVAAHHRRRPLHQLGHDLAQPLHVHRGRDAHRPHHIGEQHRDLLVLRACAGLANG